MPPVDASPRFVRSDGVSLAVREHGSASPDHPTVVLVHGYPDSQGTWDTLLGQLPSDWHLVTYDVRGAGASEAPRRREEYRTTHLVDDLVAVLDAVLPEGAQVHLVGHDWGSVQLWDAIAAEATDPRLRGRIASYTSVSGPSLDHFARVVRRPGGRRRRVARQVLHSWYIGFFQLPRVPELVWQRAGATLGRQIEKRERLPRGHFGPTLPRDATNGLELYRANLRDRSRARRRGPTEIPVLVVHPERDAFLTDVLLEDLDRVASDLRVERVDAGHWVIVTHAPRVAALVREHVEGHRG